MLGGKRNSGGSAGGIRRGMHGMCWLSLCFAMFMAVVIMAGPAFTAAGSPAGTAGREAPDQAIEILYTNDVHCGVEENIGYAGLALYKKQLEQQTPYVTLVDAGDAIQGAPIGTVSDGEYLIEIMNEVGYDVAVVGNHEFDYGMERFLELSGRLECGYASCNFTDLRTGETIFEPYKMVAYGGVKVAFVGVTTPESLTKSTPAYFQDGAGNYIYGFCEDATGEGLYARVQEAVDSARAEGAAYVILVGHLGGQGVTARWSSASVIGRTNGIDACIDGHSHEAVPSQTVKNKDGVDVLISQAGTKLNEIGRMTIGTDGAITAQLISEVPHDERSRSSYVVQKNDSLARIAKRELGDYDRWEEIYDANRDVIRNPEQIVPGMELVIGETGVVDGRGRAVDGKTARFIAGIEARYQETLRTVLGHADCDLTTSNPSTGVSVIQSAETNLGDLCADAFRYVMGTDIGLMNGGGIRSDMKAGDITYNDLLAVFPFGNSACAAEVTGQQLKDALEMASRYVPQSYGGFLHVSGLTYTIDTSVPSSVQTDDRGNFAGVEGPYRVTEIQVAGEPLELSRIYTVASHNYLLKEGGDGMTMFEGCAILRDETMTDVDLLSAYMNEKLGGTVGADYAAWEGQGRITVR